MRLPQVEDAISTCKSHLDVTKTWGTEVEAYLTRHILVMIHAEYEQKIKNIVFEKVSGVSDKHLSSFIKSAIGTVVRSIRITELSGLLGKFGEDYKATFHEKMKESGNAQQAYESILSNRRLVAHGDAQSGQITFGDLEIWFKESLVVLDTFAEILRPGRRN